MAVLPEEISTKTFTVVHRRGYDRGEVDSYLGEVATSYRAAIDKIASMADRQGLEAVGEEVKSVLAAATSSSEQIVRKAEKRAAEIVSDAKTRADRSRQESEKTQAEGKRRAFEETQAAIEEAEKAARELRTSTERRCTDLLEEAEHRHRYLVSTENELRTRMARVVEMVEVLGVELELEEGPDTGDAVPDEAAEVVTLPESAATKDSATRASAKGNGASDAAPALSGGGATSTSD